MKPVHLAALIAPNGDVSAACFDKPRKINLANALWTIRPDAVTCQKCKDTDRYKERTK